MRAATKIIFFDDNGEKFFGEGPGQLLREIEAKGSLRAAAGSMGMAYTKALTILKNAESALGFPLVIRVAGGRSGGGSQLTEAGKAWLERYEAYRSACIQANSELYQQFFPQHEKAFAVDRDQSFGNAGCVIMASGFSKRFGENKLMADFHGKPLIGWILDATEGLFTRRVVVTRHEAVAELCKEREIPVIVHDLPYRSDTVRLGVEAVGDVDRCMFCPGDQPLVSKDTVASLLLRAADQPESIWRTCCDGIPGSPVVFPKWAFPELRTLPEGKGGGAVIKRYPEKIALLQISNPLELRDADTPEDLENLRRCLL